MTERERWEAQLVGLRSQANVLFRIGEEWLKEEEVRAWLFFLKSLDARSTVGCRSTFTGGDGPNRHGERNKRRPQPAGKRGRR
jgi:hypothetical protein